MAAWRYLMAYTIPLLVFWTMNLGGLYTWIPVFYVFLAIPIADYLIGKDTGNLSGEDEIRAKNSILYTIILWLFIPIQFGLIFWFGYLFNVGHLDGFAAAGAIISIALNNGGIGITIAHELVHRSSKYEQLLGRILLMSVMYMHFAIEHVRGHHSTVATEDDPATAHKGESFYAYLLPSVYGQFVSAWHLETERLRKLKISTFSWQNEMILFLISQLLFCLFIQMVFGWTFLGLFLLTAFLSFSLLEVVNYLEHYGLERQKKSNGRYEKVSHHHSWNSDHILSRMFLFELTRHSDHHAVASRKYQVLRTHDDAPQLPSGYPGMILIALFPPLWFRIMDPLVDKAKSNMGA